MAKLTEMKIAIAANPKLKDLVVLDGFLGLVEQVKGRDPITKLKLALEFFQFRQNMANTIASQAALTSDGKVDYSRISSLGATLLGFSSDLVDRVVEGAGANPWEAVPIENIQAAAESVVDTLLIEQIMGGVELNFNGIAGITRGHMEAVVELGLWEHPFGLPPL